MVFSRSSTPDLDGELSMILLRHLTGGRPSPFPVNTGGGRGAPKGFKTALGA